MEKSVSVSLAIDGKTVTARRDETVLQCALRHDIFIPHLCTHPNLPPFGACRMCLVQIEGVRGFPTACTTPASEGMLVQTSTPALQDLRRRILELILLEHPSACLLCARREPCEQYRPRAEKAGRTTGCHTCNSKETCEVRILSDQLHVVALPVPPTYRDLAVERADPFIDRDLNLCILCGRCVRICKAQHGWATIDFVGRGSRTHIGQAFGRSLREAGCRFCGSCVDVCPTGSLADRYAKWQGKPHSVTETTCAFCEAACALSLGADRQGRVVTAQGINGAVPVCVLGRFGIPEFWNGATRLRVPQVRVGSALREAPWEEALRSAGERLSAYAGNAFALVCDTTNTLEDRYVFRRFVHDVMHSPHYIEITPDTRGVSRTALPLGVKAAIATGDLIESRQLNELELLIVQDLYPTAACERASIVFPAAAFAEVDGTVVDGAGQIRPLKSAAAPPGRARPDWWIVSQLAQAMGAGGFAHESAGAIRDEIGTVNASLRIDRDEAPAPARDPRLRPTHFRGHRLDERIRGLRELACEEAVPAVVGG